MMILEVGGFDLVDIVRNDDIMRNNLLFVILSMKTDFIDPYGYLKELNEIDIYNISNNEYIELINELSLRIVNFYENKKV